MKIGSITASVFQFFAEAHSNKGKFRGLLVMVDEPSTKAPNGSNGHRIFIPKSVAEKKLNTLIGMGINYSSDLEAHAPRHKVGVIEKAWLEGNQLWIKGSLWVKDFPEIEQDLKKKTGLGMSFEASEIDVEDTNASIWKITDLTFTGATILYKNAAAYSKTLAIAAQAARAAEQIKTYNGGKSMSDKHKKDSAKRSKSHKVSASREDKIVNALAELIEVTNKNTKAVHSLAASTEKAIVELQARSAESDDGEVESVDAAASHTATESEDIHAARKKQSSSSSTTTSSTETDDDDMDAAKKGRSASSSTESMDADADDDGDLDDMSDSPHGKRSKPNENDEPGHVADQARNRGDDTSVQSAAEIRKLQKQMKKLTASSKEVLRENSELRKQLKKTKKQLSAAADRVDRRSHTMSAASPQLKALLTKNNVDLDSITASGQKATPEEFDAMFASAGITDVKQRIAMKTEAARLGVMDEGYINRARVN